jgi:phosphoribosylglycinamide formyltransferase 1
MKKILALASGRGTDFQSILDHQTLGVLQDARIEGLVCNHKGAMVVDRAKSGGVHVFELEGITGKKFAAREERELAREKFDSECLKIVDTLGIDLIVLAGFDQIISRAFVEHCKFRILNIHPAYDLRQFGGKNMVGKKVHEAVVNSRVPYSGCTVHFITNDVDLGPPILKKKVYLDPNETAESLEQKILTLEHLAYTEAIQLFVDGRTIVNDEGTMCFVDRFSNNWDVEWSLRQRKYLEEHPQEAKLLDELKRGIENLPLQDRSGKSSS